MSELIVKCHPFREIVLDALKEAQYSGENGPQAINRAAKAIVDANPGIAFGDAFQVVWNIWEA